jgi:hypothetical protein
MDGFSTRLMMSKCHHKGKIRRFVLREVTNIRSYDLVSGYPPLEATIAGAAG